MARYVPTQDDIHWMQTTLACITQGGILAYKTAKLTYRVDHANKFLILTNPEQLANEFMSFVVHEQTKDVAQAIGWTVLIET